MKQGGWFNLRFHLFVSDVNQMEWEWEVLELVFVLLGIDATLSDGGGIW